MIKLDNLTEWQARELAKLDRHYVALLRKGRWVVWSKRADHVVEFDHIDGCRCHICSSGIPTHRGTI